MREAPEVAKRREYATKHGWLMYKLSPVGNRGAFDTVCAGPNGVVVFVEHKQATGRKRLHQIEEQKRLRRRGHIAEFCPTFESFRELLDNPVSSGTADPGY